jgi:predicted glutamine amidotransferase
MLIHHSSEPQTIPQSILKQFVKSCHWNYFKRYDIIGHHNAGWGFSYIPLKSRELIIKRVSCPIYRCEWEKLSKIKTRFLLIHARKTIFGNKRIENVHPINIGGSYIIAHNGTIKMKSFPSLNDKRLQLILDNTDLDTRRYLCTILDNLNRHENIRKAIEITLNSIHVNSAANAFLFNLHECHIIKYQSDSFNARHTTLFLDKSFNRLLISTTPLTTSALEVPNKALLSIPDLFGNQIYLHATKLNV